MLKLAALLLTAFVSLAAAARGSVRVQQGLLSGVPGSDPAVTVYKGVPFAAPPVGDLRWRAPRPPAAWRGVRKADQFSANCMQVMRESLGPWTSEYQPQGAISEDCLYLNVWTAARSSKEKRPVVMYIPGGAFTGGSGNVPVYNGENLAKKGLVVVTVNYRVGVMGFLAHPDLTKESGRHSSGNYGLLDQVAALQWIKQNIAAFGGDPERVTIMGQSAGAASVHYLMASPLAKGLFIRAIAESGTRFQQGPGETLAQAEQMGVRFAQAKGAASLAALRAMPAAEVVAPVSGDFQFRPIVDGWFLPKSVNDIYAAGEQSDVPTITGWVANEGSFNADYGKASPEEFRKQTQQRAGALADEVLKLYPAATPAEATDSQEAVARDLSMVSMYLWASNRTRTSKTKVYTYLFTHLQPGPTQGRYLAFHSSELPYVFDNLDQSNRPWTAQDRKIAATMSSYWVNFIATGDPNGKGLPEWPAFRKGSAVTMELGDTMGLRPIASTEKFNLLEKLLTKPAH
jgi:para-nitrobenzyl esterase